MKTVGFCFGLFVFLACLPTLNAQSALPREEASVRTLMDQFISNNKRQNYIDGWRVMVLSTTDRQVMEQTRQSFKQRYPYLNLSWEHNRPYYQLRVGAYATKMEALRLQSLLKRYYPGAYPTRDPNINPAEIIGY